MNEHATVNFHMTNHVSGPARRTARSLSALSEPRVKVRPAKAPSPVKPAKVDPKVVEAKIQETLRAAFARGPDAYAEACAKLGRPPTGRNRHTRRTDASLLRRGDGSGRARLYEERAALLRQWHTTGRLTVKVNRIEHAIAQRARADKFLSPIIGAA